jgi:hypothetical protein
VKNRNLLFDLGSNVPLKYAFIRFAEYANLDVSNLVFFYGEIAISGNDTPSSLNLQHQFMIVAKKKA